MPDLVQIIHCGCLKRGRIDIRSFSRTRRSRAAMHDLVVVFGDTSGDEKVPPGYRHWGRTAYALSLFGLTQSMPTIRIVNSLAELEAVSRFRYSIYVEEMKRKQKYADHDRKTVLDPLDCEGVYNLAAWENGQVVGAIRMNFLRLTDIGAYFEQYNLGGLPPEVLALTSITTRLMVHPSHRKATLAIRLACETYRFGLVRGITTNFIDCNHHLVPFFTALGYIVHRNDLIHPEYGAVTVMRLNATDLNHLEQIRSPFRKILQVWNNRRRESFTTRG